jgi:predicted transposase/invertase (TIGR01784 family)
VLLNIRLTVDYAFKRVFGHKGNTDLLIAFLNDIMGLSGDRRIKKVTLLNPFSTKNFQADKQNILDVKAVDNFGNIFDIEVQVIVSESYPKRILHYACNMYVEQLSIGMPYTRLKPVISINILDEVLFGGIDRYSNRFTLVNDEGDLTLTEDLTFYTLELPKFDLSTDRLSEPVEEWLYLIKHAHELDINMINKFKYIPIKKIMEELEQMSKNKEERQQYKERMRAQESLLTIKEDAFKNGKKKGRKEGRKEGIQKGRKEGIQKGRKETAKKMKHKGMDTKIIEEITGLSQEEIGKL